jgi:primary-amine oxidase
MRWLLTLVVLIPLAVGQAAAQDLPPPAKVDAATVQQALQQLGVQSNRQADAYVFTMNARPLELRILAQGARLLLLTRFEQSNASLETINRYNEQVAITTRAVRYANRGLILEAGLDCTLGVREEVVRRFILNFARDAKTFETFLDRNKEAAPDTRPVDAKPQSLPLAITPGTDDKEIEVTFPTNEPSPAETAWRVVWDMTTAEQANKEGFKFSDGRKKATLLFRIKKAFYRPGPKAPWLQVLDDVHPSEFYVPYYFQNTRFFDLRDVGGYTTLQAKEGGARSKLVGNDRRVMAELRDTGIAYKHGSRTRRGEAFVLWANFVAGNYTYLVEYCFHDDGAVVLKHAPTGYNFFSHFDEAAHMHNVLWRIGVRLGVESPGQAMNQQLHLVKLPFDPKGLGPQGKLDIQPIEQESAHDFDAKEFTRLRITNPDLTLFPKDPKNEKRVQRPIGYDLIPTISGQARHYRYKDEGFSTHDFWVTRADCPEKMYVYLHDYFRGKIYNGYKSVPQPLTGSDGLVLWHMSSALHIPRGEDGIYFGTSTNNGQALVTWTSVELRPRNLFTKTPIYRVK